MDIELRGVPIVFFEEGGMIIAHCIPLDVSSGGRDLEEARRNIHDAIAGFIEACEAMGTLEQVLEESGFVNDGERWLPPAVVQLDSLDIAANAT